MKKANFETLVGELLKERPDSSKVRHMARELGLSFRGDLVELMAEVLQKADVPARKRRMPAEKLEAEV